MEGNATPSSPSCPTGLPAPPLIDARCQQVKSRLTRNSALHNKAREIRAIIRALGFEKSIHFGSSSGGIFAFQFAHDFPEMVDHLISHEAPTVTLLPDASEVFEWFLLLMEVYETHEVEQAASKFNAKLIEYGDQGIPETVPPERENVRNFWDNEFPSLMGSVPNLWRLKENRTSIGAMRLFGVKVRSLLERRRSRQRSSTVQSFWYRGITSGLRLRLRNSSPIS